MTKDKMIARRASKGHNAAESAARLEELLTAHSGDNLVYALVYNNFATEKGAAKFVANLTK